MPRLYLSIKEHLQEPCSTSFLNFQRGLGVYTRSLSCDKNYQLFIVFIL